MLHWFTCGVSGDSLCLNMFDAKKLAAWTFDIVYWSDTVYVLCGPKTGE